MNPEATNSKNKYIFVPHDPQNPDKKPEKPQEDTLIITQYFPPNTAQEETPSRSASPSMSAQQSNFRVMSSIYKNYEPRKAKKQQKKGAASALGLASSHPHNYGFLPPVDLASTQVSLPSSTNQSEQIFSSQQSQSSIVQPQIAVRPTAQEPPIPALPFTVTSSSSSEEDEKYKTNFFDMSSSSVPCLSFSDNKDQSCEVTASYHQQFVRRAVEANRLGNSTSSLFPSPSRHRSALMSAVCATKANPSV